MHDQGYRVRVRVRTIRTAMRDASNNYPNPDPKSGASRDAQNFLIQYLYRLGERAHGLIKDSLWPTFRRGLEAFMVLELELTFEKIWLGLGWKGIKHIGPSLRYY